MDKTDKARKTTLTIFYAWQSDLPKHSNKDAVRKVLRALRTPLEQEFSHLSLDVEVDEATRNEAGSPNIPQTILAKIAKSQAFVGDISLVNHGVVTDPKKTPNPNVLFELGFAVAMLGWSRIILLFNESFGDPKDLPFDIDRQRVSIYRLKEPSDDPSRLQSLCKEALTAIITHNPSKPADVIDPAASKRRRDLRTIGLLLLYLNWKTVELHLKSAPSRVSEVTLDFEERFREVRNSSTFHLYDKKLLKLIDNFVKRWHETTRFGHRYEASRHSAFYRFTFSDVEKLREKEEHDFHYIELELTKLDAAMRSLHEYLRKEYVELDLELLSEAAWDKYKEDVDELEKRLKNAGKKGQ